MDYTRLQKWQIYSNKNHFRPWIFTEVEQLFIS